MFYYIVLICYCFILLLCFILFMTMQALSGYVWSAVDIWPASSQLHILSNHKYSVNTALHLPETVKTADTALWVIYVR